MKIRQQVGRMSGVRPHLCEEVGCGFAARFRSALVAHALTHTGERPYACEEVGCGYTCTTRGSLVVHARTHTGERPYACEEEGCGYTCTTRGNLVRHTRTHTGERPVCLRGGGLRLCCFDWRSPQKRKTRKHLEDGEGDMQIKRSSKNGKQQPFFLRSALNPRYFQRHHAFHWQLYLNLSANHRCIWQLRVPPPPPPSTTSVTHPAAGPAAATNRDRSTSMLVSAPPAL